MMDEAAVKRLCIGIVGQAVSDMKKVQDYSEGVEAFLNSDWGEIVTGVVGIDAQRINKSLGVSERAQAARDKRAQRNNKTHVAKEATA